MRMRLMPLATHMQQQRWTVTLCMPVVFLTAAASLATAALTTATTAALAAADLTLATAAVPITAASIALTTTATATALTVATADLLGDHLLCRRLSRRNWLEPQLLRWYHAQRRRAIRLERAIGGGVWRNLHAGHD